MDLGELVFNLNVRTEGLMAGVQTAMDRMGKLANVEDEVGRSAGVLEGRLQILSRAFDNQRDKVKTVNAAYAEAVAAHGLSSQAARDAEAALMKELQTLQRLAERLNATSTQADRLGQSNRQLSVETIAAFTAMAGVASRVMNVIIDAVGAGIEAYNKYTNSIKGLRSVAEGVGVGTVETQAALDGLTDAFFSSTAAATSLKNLLSRGYSLDQAVNVINRLKDAAAYGRQANLSLSEAVQSATEGLKNENSILVDNAGVQKNVSKMWEEYAKNIGVSTQALTLNQKVEAEYRGIMEETRYQMGDMQKLMTDLSGTQAQAAMSGELLARTYGDSMAPAVQVGTAIWAEALNIFRDLVSTMPGVASGLTVATVAAGGLVILSKVSILAQDFIARMVAAQAAATGFAGALYTAMPWLLAIAAAVGVATAVYTSVAKAAEESARRTEEANQKRQEELRSNQATISSLEALRDRYAELSPKKQLSFSESREMRSIEQQLAEKYGINVAVLTDLAGAYDTVAAAIRNKRAETIAEMQATLQANLSITKEAQIAQTTEANNARQTAVSIDAISAAYDTLTIKQKSSMNVIDSVRLAMLRMLPEQDGAVYARATNLMNSNFRAFLRDFTGQLALMRSELNTTLDAEQKAMVNSAKAAMDLVDNSLEAVDVPQTFKSKMREIVGSLDFSGGLNVDAFVDRYADLLKNVNVTPALDAMQEMNQKIMEGGVISEGDQQKYATAYQTLYDALIGKDATGLLPSYSSTWVSFFDTMTNGMMSVSNEARSNADAWSKYWDSISLDAVQKISDAGLDAVIEKAQNSGKEMRQLAEDANEMRHVMDAIAFLDTNGVDFSAPFEKQTAAAQEAIDTLQDYYKITLDSANVFEAIKTAAQAYKAELDGTNESLQTYYDRLIAAMTAMKASGVDNDGSKLAENDIRALDSAISAYVIAKEALSQSLNFSGNPISPEYIQKAIAGAKTLGADYRSLAEDMEDSQEKMDVLTTLTERWGDKESEAFRAASEEAEKLYGNKIGSQEYANKLLDEERSRWDGLSVMWQAQYASYNANITLLEAMRASVADNTDTAWALDAAILTLREDVGSLTAAANSGWAGVESGAMSAAFIFQDLKGSVDAVGEALQSIRLKQDTVKDAKALLEEAKRLKTAGKDVADTWKQKVSQALGHDFTGSLDEAAEALSAMGISLDTAFSGMKDQLDAWESKIQEAMAAEISDTLRINPNATVDTSKYQAALAIINAWRALLGLPKLDAPSKGGGGGGGGNSAYKNEIASMQHEIDMDRMTLEEQLAALEAMDEKFRNRKGKSTLKKDDQQDLEERIHDVREQIRKQNLDDAYAALDHRKVMGQLTVAQEIEMLNQIRAAHQMTDDELLRWEEQMYSAQQALRAEALQADRDLLAHRVAMGELTVQQEIEMLQEIVNTHELTQAELWEITEEIYNKQQQLQEETLSRQQSAIKSAYAKVVEALKNRYAEEKAIEQKALDDRIEVLQEQTAAENEAEKVRDYEEALKEKQRKLRLTKSARERRELQKEIDDVIAAEALRQTQLARQAEIDALREEKEAVNDKYAALTEEENLRQEALRLVMSDNLQAMADLIASYGTVWEDAGESLAQYLTDGITGQKQQIIDALEDFMDGIADAVNEQLDNIRTGVPTATTRSLTVNLYGAVFHENADVEGVVDAIDRHLRQDEN